MRARNPSRKSPPLAWTGLGAVLFLAAGLRTQAPAETRIYVEGEAAVETDFRRADGFSRSRLEHPELLSGGDWLTCAGESEAAGSFARWDFAVATAGRYQLWARKFWRHGAFRWRIDDGTWQDCGRDAALVGRRELQKDVEASWVRLGAVDLRLGKRRLEIRLLAGEKERRMAALDLFVFARGPFFLPRGTGRPLATAAEAGHFVFDPPLDDFDAKALSLRARNEALAGARGPLRRDGARILDGSGRPFRVWGVNAGAELVRLDEESLGYLVRSIAKRGVNLVRVHTPFFDRENPGRVDAALRAGLHRFVRVAKKQGIYTALSFWFPLWYEPRPSDGYAGYDSNRKGKPFALLFTEEKFRARWRTWARELLDERGPGGEPRLADEPALAWVELQNEDSLLFWTFDPKDVPTEQWTKLERGFATWAAARYGSVAQAVRRWRRAPRDLGEGRLELLGAGHMTAAGRSGKQRRMADQVRFLAETQRDVYRQLARYLREDLRLRSMVVCGNWHTADDRMLDAVERWTYGPGDLLDRHAYFGGEHRGEASSYLVREGHEFTNRSALRHPLAMPVQAPETANMPLVFSEIGWPAPNAWRSEMLLLCAGYGALQGVDGFCFFTLDGPDWDGELLKFGLQHPTGLVQFPAFALAFRRGDLAEAEPVLRFSRPIARYCLEGAPLAPKVQLDALRATGKDTGGGSLAFLVGKVQRGFGARGDLRAAELAGFVRNGVITSSTKEHRWDPKSGVLEIVSPRFVACGGFLAARGAVELGPFTVHAECDYAIVAIVALDDVPLAKSRRILVQLGSTARPSGFRHEKGKITALGSLPWQSRRIEGHLAWKAGPAVRRATVLDGNLMPTRELEMRQDGVRFPGDAHYVLLEAR